MCGQVADISDVVRQRADALMLSGESAVGVYPEKALGVLRQVSTRIEEWCRSAAGPHYAVEQLRSARPGASTLWQAHMGPQPGCRLQLELPPCIGSNSYWAADYHEGCNRRVPYHTLRLYLRVRGMPAIMRRQ